MSKSIAKVSLQREDRWVTQRRRDPRRAKVLDYKNPTTNSYGENDKSSRVAIPFRKAWTNKTYRRSIKAVTSASGLERYNRNLWIGHLIGGATYLPH